MEHINFHSSMIISFMALLGLVICAVLHAVSHMNFKSNFSQYRDISPGVRYFRPSTTLFELITATLLLLGLIIANCYFLNMDKDTYLVYTGLAVVEAFMCFWYTSETKHQEKTTKEIVDYLNRFYGPLPSL